MLSPTVGPSELYSDTVERVKPKKGLRAFASKTTKSDRLKIIRRLDWRFLLPDPRLRRVVYFGHHNDQLATALKPFCESLHICLPQRIYETQNGQGLFDLAVVRTQDSKALEAIRSALKPGGYLYCEMQLGKSLLPGIAKRVEMLKNAGFAEVSTYWHRPDFERSAEIIPLHKQALDDYFRRDRQDLKGRMKTLAARCLRAVGMLALITSSVSFVARKA